METPSIELRQLHASIPAENTTTATTRTTAESSPGTPGSPVDHGEAAEASSVMHEFSLPPVDGGRHAWLFLAACFTFEAFVWGFPFSFGVFQDYYTSHEPFASSGNIAAIGTCAMGIMYLDVPLVLRGLRLYPRLARWAPFGGLVVMCISLAMSSFSTTTTHLIISQGILYAIGGSVAYGPCILYLDEWFVRKKGFAYGIMWSGTGLAGVILPLVLEFFLTKYGFATTLRIWTCALFICAAPLCYFIKPRLPPSSKTHLQRLHLGFLYSKPFVLHQISNTIEALGFFLPGIYLPTYARSALGAAAFPSALTVLLVNVASVGGCIAMGSLIDRFHVTTCMLLSTVGATLGVFLLWGFATNLGALYVFCLVYGLFAGSFTSTWPGIMRDITARNTEDEGKPIDPSMVFGFLAVGRGLGNVASGPLSEALIRSFPWKERAFAGYGSGYGTLIVFTGATAFAGGATYVWRRIGWL